MEQTEGRVQCRGLTPASAALRLGLQVPSGVGEELPGQYRGAGVAETAQALGGGAGAGGARLAEAGAAGRRLTHYAASWRTPRLTRVGAQLEHSSGPLSRVCLSLPSRTGSLRKM